MKHPCRGHGRCGEHDLYEYTRTLRVDHQSPVGQHVRETTAHSVYAVARLVKFNKEDGAGVAAQSGELSMRVLALYVTTYKVDMLINVVEARLFV